VTISLSGRSWRTLRDLARESSDGRETAGFVFADHVWSWNREVSVRRVTRSVKQRSERSAALDIGELVAEKAALRQEGVADRFGEVGSWHTHPISEDGRPSDADLAHWLNSRDFLDRAFYIGLILTADGRDERWSRPTVHAWITRREGTLDRPVCEPALVSTDEGRSS
jgi:Prokaryotic homologs of the JAB domain